jgi:hypothetical protein
MKRFVEIVGEFVAVVAIFLMAYILLLGGLL